MTDHLPLWGDAAIRAFPDAFDNRQRPVCGRWSPLGGPCVCGDPDRHRETEPVDVERLARWARPLERPAVRPEYL